MTEAPPPPVISADVIVVGAGPAGMASAVRASESGASVLVLDDNPGTGGQIWRGGEQAHSGSQPSTWFERFRRAEVTLLAGAQVISALASSKTLLVETWEKSLELRFKKLIVAAGAREIFLPFPGWTLPGVAGVGGLQALAKSGVSCKVNPLSLLGAGRCFWLLPPICAN